MSEVAVLVEQVRRLTGAAPPGVMDDDAPIPSEAGAVGSLYYVGLIGGKDVGKTSLVNAIAGQSVAEPTGHGEGTRIATAYCHRDAEANVRRDLAEFKEKLEIVAHHADALRGQVLLDLPDIDSVYADHIRLTRRMLRHMLYPVWVQSVEKYADNRPRQLLLQVAEGNDPANFLFVLSKVDQLIDREGLEAAGELAADYGERLAQTLELEKSPEVMLCSARRPDEYDLPRLCKALGVARSAEKVERDRSLAIRRQTTSIVDWIDEQNLPERAAGVKRLVDDAEGVLAERVAMPILEEALPRLEEDPGHQMTLAEPAAKERVRAWPIVAWIDAALAPIVALVRRNLSPAASEAAALDQLLSDAGQSTAKSLRGAFAQLHTAYPLVAEVYDDRRLWESPESESAASSLRRRLNSALRHQREAIAQRLRPSPWLAPLRWLLTVGVVLWFVVIQPIVAVVVPKDEWSWTEIGQEAVALLSAQSLLASAGIVVTYLLLLWGILRMRAYRSVAKWRRKMNRDTADAEASPAAQTMRWTEELLAPLQARHDELKKLSVAAARLRQQAAKESRAVLPERRSA